MSEQSFSDVTPYVAAQIATELLRADGILAADEEIAPQSMYGNKTIERYGTPRREGGDGIYFVGTSFKAWLDAQREGRESGRRSKVNLRALLSEYDNAEQDAEDGAPTDETAAQLEASLAERGVEVPTEDDAPDFASVTAQADTSALEGDADTEDGPEAE